MLFQKSFLWSLSNPACLTMKLQRFLCPSQPSNHHNQINHSEINQAVEGAYLVDFIHPVTGKFKNQFIGLHSGGHGGGHSAFSARTAPLTEAQSGLSQSKMSGCLFRDHGLRFKGSAWPCWKQPGPARDPPEASTPGRPDEKTE